MPRSTLTASPARPVTACPRHRGDAALGTPSPGNALRYLNVNEEVFDELMVIPVRLLLGALPTVRSRWSRGPGGAWTCRSSGGPVHESLEQSRCESPRTESPGKYELDRAQTLDPRPRTQDQRQPGGCLLERDEGDCAIAQCDRRRSRGRYRSWSTQRKPVLGPPAVRSRNGAKTG